MATKREMKKDAKSRGLEHPQSQFTYALRGAVSGAPSKRPFDWPYQWEDKPHRLVFAATREIDRLAEIVRELLEKKTPAAMRKAREALEELDGGK